MSAQSENLARDILAEANSAPHEQRMVVWRRRLSEIDDQILRNSVETLVLYWAHHGIPRREIIVLIHGIRTHANWHSRVQNIFDGNPAFEVVSLKYDYFDACRFWFPYLFRSIPVKKIIGELRHIQRRNRSNNISVVAHSYGTYVISKILQEYPDVTIHRLILCGSIISTKFPWNTLANPAHLIVNDCGTKDIWPVIAKATTWGYGASGRFGFGTYTITDRYHELTHNGFFTDDFINTYWVPFLRDGEIVNSTWNIDRPTPSLLISLITIAPINWALVAVIIFLIAKFLF